MNRDLIRARTVLQTEGDRTADMIHALADGATHPDLLARQISRLVNAAQDYGRACAMAEIAAAEPVS